MKVSVDLAALAAAADAEARKHPPRSPERRAASALYYALDDAGTIASVRRALAAFAAPGVEAAAIELLHRLAAQLNHGEDG